VDFGVGEILVSNEDARDHRQLIWEGFAGNPKRDEYTTYLFFCDAVDSPADKSLLALFEQYFDALPRYKRPGARWQVNRPVFGFIPSFHNKRRNGRKRTADDRILLVGDAAGLFSPLTFCGFGSQVRDLKRLTHLTHVALDADLMDTASLSQIRAFEPRVAQVASLAEFLRPTPRSPPSAVNETLNAVMAALHNLDERVRREVFQDRMSFDALKNLLSHTARLYPRIFQRVREHLGARGTFWWLANIAEAAFSERRSARLGRSERSGQSDKAAQQFARLARLYKDQPGGDGPD
jgi:lycopene cyclase CruA